VETRLWSRCREQCGVPASAAMAVTCHTSQPMAGGHMGRAAHTWSRCVACLPVVEACRDLTSAPLWDPTSAPLQGGGRSEAAHMAERTAAHLPSQAGGTAVWAAVVPSPPPACCWGEQSMTWGLKPAAGNSLTWLFSLKGGRDQECDSAHISGPAVLPGKHLRALSFGGVD